LLGEVPGEIERVHAVEHAEVVRLAPHDLLPARAHAERQIAELDVGVELAQRILEAEDVAFVARDAVELEDAGREATLAAGLGERQVAAVRAHVDVLLLAEAGRRVVDAVVDAAPQDRQARLVDERDVVLVVELPGLEPVVVEAQVDGVAVHDELVGVDVRSPHDVRGLNVAGRLYRSELRHRGASRRPTAKVTTAALRRRIDVPPFAAEEARVSPEIYRKVK